MAKIHPGHDVLSLFGLTAKHQALSQAAQKSLLPTLISAFLITLVAGVLLALATGNLTLPRLMQAGTSQIEPVAYQPSQAISQEISAGYLGVAQ